MKEKKESISHITTCVSVHPASTVVEIFETFLFNSLSMLICVRKDFQKQISFSLGNAEHFKVIQKTLIFNSGFRIYMVGLEDQKIYILFLIPSERQ